MNIALKGAIFTEALSYFQACAHAGQFHYPYMTPSGIMYLVSASLVPLRRRIMIQSVFFLHLCFSPLCFHLEPITIKSHELFLESTRDNARSKLYRHRIATTSLNIPDHTQYSTV